MYAILKIVGTSFNKKGYFFMNTTCKKIGLNLLAVACMSTWNVNAGFGERINNFFKNVAFVGITMAAIYHLHQHGTYPDFLFDQKKLPTSNKLSLTQVADQQKAQTSISVNNAHTSSMSNKPQPGHIGYRLNGYRLVQKGTPKKAAHWEKI